MQIPVEAGVPFKPDQPALDLFPTTLWSRHAGRRLRQASGIQLGLAKAYWIQTTARGSGGLPGRCVLSTAPQIR